MKSTRAWQALALLPAIVNAYPPVGSCTGNCTGFMHDPNVVYKEGTYYRFTTNGKINIATAPQISGPWTYQGAALPKGSIIDLPGNQDLWCPDVHEINGRYYMTYAVSRRGWPGGDIGIAVSSTLEPGSWTDHGSLGIPKQGYYNRIDPNMIQLDQNSTPYLSFGSFHQDLFQAPLENPPLGLASTTFVHLEQNTTARPDGAAKGASEGSYQFRWTVGGKNYWYLFWSSGACCLQPPNLLPPGEEYKIMVGRAEHPTGPFVDRKGRSLTTQNGGTLVLGSHGDVFAPGGQGVMVDPQLGKVILYYHYVNPKVGYAYDQFQFGWNELDFSSGWPVVVG